MTTPADTITTTPLGPRALFVSWIRHHGRSEDLALALGADCEFVAVGRLTNRRSAPLRHLWQALVTLQLLAARRPRVLVVMAPPALLVLLGLLWARLTGARLVVDAHSKAAVGRTWSSRLAARADLVLVTLPSLAAAFPRAVALHDPPARAVTAAEHDEVVFPASWYADEPIEDVLDAAAQLPDVRFAITGTPPSDLVVPPNVRLTGFLPRAEFLALVAGAPLVLALTTRESTMQRAAYEAVAAARPVVASDTQALRSYLFDAAVYAGSLPQAIRSALGRLPELAQASARVREEQRVAFDEALRQVSRALS